jgi:hypothetical protein
MIFTVLCVLERVFTERATLTLVAERGGDERGHERGHERGGHDEKEKDNHANHTHSGGAVSRESSSSNLVGGSVVAGGVPSRFSEVSEDMLGICAGYSSFFLLILVCISIALCISTYPLDSLRYVRI